MPPHVIEIFTCHRSDSQWLNTQIGILLTRPCGPLSRFGIVFQHSQHITSDKVTIAKSNASTIMTILIVHHHRKAGAIVSDTIDWSPMDPTMGGAEGNPRFQMGGSGG